MADELEISEGMDLETTPSPEEPDVIDLRLDLVSDLEERMLKEGLTSGTTKERLALFQEVVSNDDLEEATQVHKVISENLESLEAEPVAALNSLEEASGFVAAYMLAKNRPEAPSIHSVNELVQLAGFAETAVHRKLAETWKLLADNPDTKLGALFTSDILPAIIREANQLATAAIQATNTMSGKAKQAAGWVKDQFEERPVVAGSVALLGGIGLGTMIYKAIRSRRIKNRIASQELESPDSQSTAGKLLDTGGNIVKRTAGVLSYVPHALIATGGLAIAGMILGTEQTQSYLEREMDGNLAFVPKFLYQNRVPATFIHLCSNRPLDALGTFTYGARDEKSKMRHEIYAKFFDAKDKQIWAVAGVPLMELLEADPAREYPLGAGFLQHVPFLNSKLTEHGVKPVENLIRDKFLENMDRLVEVDPSIKTKTVDEALRIAFAEGIFDSLDEETSDTNNPEARELLGGLKDFDDEFDRIASVETLSSDDIEILQVEANELHDELDELRLAMPSEFTELKKAFGRAFPLPMVEMAEDQGAVDYGDDVDLIATQEFYEQFADQIMDSESSALMKDIEEVREAQAMLVDLEVGQIPSEDLKLKIESLKGVNRRMETWKFRAEQSRKEAVRADADDWNAREDLPEVATFYYLGYTGIPNIIKWSIEEVFDSETGAKQKVFAMSAGVGAVAVGIDGAKGLYQIASGNKAVGAFRVLIPGPKLAHDVAVGLRNFGHVVGYNTPQMLLQKVVSGRMTPEKALHLSKNALRHADKVNLESWTTRMKGFEDIVEIFDNNADDVARYLDDPSLARSIDQSTDALQWQKSLRNLVKESFGESLEEFFTRLNVEKTERLAQRISPEKVANMINKMAQRIGLAELPYDDLVRILNTEGPVYGFFKTTLSRGARYGLPVGAALLGAYFACDVVHTGSKTKADKFAMFGAGLLAAEGTIKLGLMAKNTVHGAAMAARVSKHPYIIGIGAILGLVGVSYLAEKAIEPLTKSRDPLTANLVLGAGFTTYLLTGGQYIDLYKHYLGEQTEKEYFTRTTFLPGLPEVRMAFKDAGVGYFNEMTPEQAINVYNYKVRQDIRELESQEPENEEEAAEIEAAVALLNSRIIDHEWALRRSYKFERDKGSIAIAGAELESAIFEAYGDKLTNVEKAHVSSVLTIDVPHSWMDEEFFDIEEDPQIILLRRLTDELGIEDKLDEFIAMKRNIKSDIDFYQIIDMEDDIVTITPEKRMEETYRAMGVFDEDIEVANSIFDEFMGEEGFEMTPESIAA